VSAGTGGTGDLSRETLMRYLDGELPPEERREMERALEASTELQRELALYRAMHEDLAGLRLKTGAPGGRSVWTAVHRRLTRPMGWIFLNIGVLVWLVFVVYIYFTSPAPSWEKLATGAVVIGVLLLFTSVIHDRYREWLTDPYRDVER
jgi:hypothetical protein